MNNGVSFRRINGRIVPIKINNSQINRLPIQKKELKKGAAEIGAGVVAGAAAGVGAAKVAKKAASFAVSARKQYQHVRKMTKVSDALGQMNLFSATAKEAGKRTIRKAVQTRAKGAKLFQLRNPILNAGALAATLLVGHGVKRINDALNGQTNEIPAGKVAGAVAATATYGAYYRALGFKKPVEIAVNIYSRMKGVKRPFQKPIKTPFGHGKV